jgi:hypothetical protein
MVEGNHCVAACAKASYSFVVLLPPAVNELTVKTVNDKSSKSVYVMSVYSKGPIRLLVTLLHSQRAALFLPLLPRCSHVLICHTRASQDTCDAKEGVDRIGAVASSVFFERCFSELLITSDHPETSIRRLHTPSLRKSQLAPQVPCLKRRLLSGCYLAVSYVEANHWNQSRSTINMLRVPTGQNGHSDSQALNLHIRMWARKRDSPRCICICNVHHVHDIHQNPTCTAEATYLLTDAIDQSRYRRYHTYDTTPAYTIVFALFERIVM